MHHEDINITACSYSYWQFISEHVNQNDALPPPACVVESHPPTWWRLYALVGCLATYAGRESYWKG